MLTPRVVAAPATTLVWQDSQTASRIKEGLAGVATDGEAGARYRRRVAEVHLRTGDHEAARSAFLAALDHQPEDLEALAGLKKLGYMVKGQRAGLGGDSGDPACGERRHPGG